MVFLNLSCAGNPGLAGEMGAFAMNSKKMCVVLAALCAMHCGRGDEFPEKETSGTTTASPGTAEPCLYGEYDLSRDELILLASGKNEYPCEDRVKNFAFTITKNEPKVVVV